MTPLVRTRPKHSSQGNESKIDAALGEVKPKATASEPLCNHAMGWHALRLAGIRDSMPEFGRLFELSL